MDYLDTRPWARSTSEFPAAFAMWVDAELSDLTGVSNRPRPQMVDLGAGTGDFIDAFAALGYAVWGYDLDKRHHNVVQVDLQKTVLTEVGVADVVLCRNVIEHMLDPRPVLSSMFNSLKPDGVAVIAVPDWRTYAPIFYSDYTHVRPYDRVSLPDLLKVSGFEVLRVKEIVQHAGALDSALLRALAAMIKACVPLGLCETLARATGVDFFRWSALRTVVVFCRKRSEV